MTSEGLGEMFEGDSANTCAGKFPLVSMGGRAEGLACADPGARSPIGASGNYFTMIASQIEPFFLYKLDKKCFCLLINFLLVGLINNSQDK